MSEKLFRTYRIVFNALLLSTLLRFVDMNYPVIRQVVGEGILVVAGQIAARSNSDFNVDLSPMDQ